PIECRIHPKFVIDVPRMLRPQWHTGEGGPFLFLPERSAGKVERQPVAVLASIGMGSGPFAYLWLVAKNACRHSFHAAHSAILVLIIFAGIVTSVDPRIQVLVDLHGWQVAAFVLGGIVFVRLLLAPYWIWKSDQNNIAILRDGLNSGFRAAQRA